MRLGDWLEKLRNDGRKGFVAYLTAGDPDLGATAAFVKALARGGADVIELGVPHSDPVADGPTNQAAAERALRSGTTLIGILEMVKQLRAEGATVPLVLFTYFNPILRLGLEKFAEQAAQSGIDGVLVVDLPPEEASEFSSTCREAGLANVFLTSPTTAPARLDAIERLSTGFVYYVSRTGVTGARKQLSDSLPSEVAALKARVKRPLYVGFGVSSAEQVRAIARVADGVIVGSALVDEIAAGRSTEETASRLEARVKALRKGFNELQEEIC